MARFDLRALFANRQGDEEAPLDVILDRAPLFLWAVDAAGTFTVASGNGLAAIGIEEGQVIGQSAFELFADHPQIISNIRLAQGGSECQANVSFAGRTFDAHFLPRRDVKSPRTKGGVIGICIDITQRRRAEIALAATEARYRAIFQSSGAALILQDVSRVRREFERLRSNGVRDLDQYFSENPKAVADMLKMAKIAQANPTALKMYGLSEAAAINRAQTEFVPPESLQVTRRVLVAHFRGDAGLTVRTKHRTVAGNDLHLIAHISFPRQHMLADSALIALIDITPQVIAETALSDSQLRADALMAAIAMPAIEIQWDSAAQQIKSVANVNAAAVDLFAAHSAKQLKAQFGQCVKVGTMDQLKRLASQQRLSSPVPLVNAQFTTLAGEGLVVSAWLGWLTDQRALLTLSRQPLGSGQA